MDKDIQSQLDRAKELLQDLNTALNADLQAQEVSGKTKNLVQEVLLKIKHLLDQVMYKFYQKYYWPHLSGDQRKAAKVYFPTVPKKADLKSVLGMAKMGDLELKNPRFYNFLDSVQPYNQDYSWLKLLSDYANEKHMGLAPQTKKESSRIIVSDKKGEEILSWTAEDVAFGPGDILINGVPIDPKTKMPVPNDLLETKIERWVAFLFENSDINVLWLCKKSVEDGENIIKRTLGFVENDIPLRSKCDDLLKTAQNT